MHTSWHTFPLSAVVHICGHTKGVTEQDALLAKKTETENSSSSSLGLLFFLLTQIAPFSTWKLTLCGVEMEAEEKFSFLSDRNAAVAVIGSAGN